MAVAPRPLTDEEARFLAELSRRQALGGAPPTDDERARVQGLITQAQAGLLDPSPWTIPQLEALIAPTPSTKEVLEIAAGLVALGLLPAWWLTLLRIPIIGGLIGWFIGLIAAVFARRSAHLVTTWAGVGAVGFYSWLFAKSPRLAELLGNAIATGARGAPQLWTQVVAQVVSDLTGGEVSRDEVVKAVGPGGTFEAALPLARTIYRRFTDFIAPTNELTPEQGLENAQRYLSANLSLNMTAWYLGLVGEMMSLGISRSIKDLPAQISWAMGLGWLSWLVFGVPFRAAISEPLETLYNRTYQFERYTPAQLVALARAGILTHDEYLEGMADRGFSYDKATALLAEARTQPSLAELRTWWEQGLIDTDRLSDRLRRLGYDEADVWRLVTSTQRARTEDEWKALVSTAERLYSKGRVSEADLRALWRQAGLSDEEQDLRLVRLQLQGIEERTLTKAEVLDAYRDGALDDREARTRLREMGYLDADIDLLLRREVRRLSPAQVLDLFTRGQISREEATKRLRDQGYPDEDIPLLLSLREARLTSGQILDAIQAGLLSAQQGRQRLRALGFSDEDIDVLVALQVRGLQPREIVQALRAGLLTSEQARERLARLGYSAEDITVLLALPVRTVTPADVIEALRRGLLTREEARARLLALGLSADDADLLLDLRYVLLTVGQVLDAVRAGLVGLPEGLVRLQQLGYSPQDAELLVEVLLRRR